MKKQIIIISVFLILGATVSSGQTQNKATKIEPLFAGKKSGSTITRKEFLSDSTIHYNSINGSASYNYVTVSFNITIIQKSKDSILDIPSDENKIPQQVRDIVKNIPTGSKIFFEYMRAKLDVESVNDKTVPKPTDTYERPMEPMSFTIVDE